MDPQESNVSELPEGYRDIPEEDRKKAQVFFERGKSVAGTGNFEYAIEMYLQGVAIDPDDTTAHQDLRDVSLKRKASGGKSLGMIESIKLKRPSRDDKQNLLNSEKLLAYDPGNTDHMLSMMQNALRAGFYDTVLWIGPILQKANADSPRPDYNKFIILKDTYKAIKQWKLASDACHYAIRIRPDDMDLQTEAKNLAARFTMEQGNYEKAGSFRDSVRDMKSQQRYLDQDKDTADLDAATRMIKEAEAEYEAEPQDPGKLMKLVDSLEKTEIPEYENRAIDLLQAAFSNTTQFRFRRRIGVIQLKQMTRMERSKRQALAQNPTDEALKKDYADFRREQAEFELKEFQLWSENYPTDTQIKFEIAKRMFVLRQFNDAIPIFQHVRNDPKNRAEATIYLAMAFLESNYLDEADETLDALIKEYPVKGDSKSKQMYYWRARVLEQKNQTTEAIKHYSQVAQWDFNYLDVQSRIKRLRGGGANAE